MIKQVNLSNLGVDRRKKLSDEDKQKIKELYASGLYSYNDLKEIYKVSKSTIRFIVKPNSYDLFLEQNNEYKKANYNKEKRRKYMREYRNKRKQLINKLVKDV